MIMSPQDTIIAQTSNALDKQSPEEEDDTWAHAYSPPADVHRGHIS